MTLDELGGEVVDMIRRGMDDAGVNATGRTSKSIEWETTTFRLTVFAEAGRRAPVDTLEKGRGPGPMPDVADIVEWLDAKGVQTRGGGGLMPAEAKEKAAYAIARKIAREGTDRYSEPRKDVYTPAVDYAIDKARDIFAAKVESFIK